ncbi:hypothetical protein INP83_03090 [Mucilaginibacter sp. 21P]|uniref:hypothetical protein n=1 Tax=Mucilaginibacter sp. 21P TaxID=2778902 RepID=UPI001C55BC30|nr:hypothetical protein [Mucilaginibacter sp. 21P]QXV66095.1 hypothetical protein INP83_03090 [Mucilaginibacter sp. 21P]
MTTNTFHLSRGRYIADLEPFKTAGVPSNSIIHKSVPGCGITTFEIQYAKHHSIMIEPNVPVIQDKVADHNKKFPKSRVLGVYKGVGIDDIKIYLLNDDIEYKKIITTPEGFVKKVLKAFGGNEETMLNDYFLLYDECERIITDISYRGSIAAPLDIFFKFKNKALVSATTLPYRDSRFSKFSHYIIKPDYDFSKPLDIINTNNVITALEKHLRTLNDQPVCIFLNSTEGIHAIIKALDIKNQSAVFCGADSVVKLRIKDFRAASSDFTTSDMKEYNFFTSRFFSAFDIILDYKPNVIMISDVVFAHHSTLDPFTECIQIPGRFRNGVASLTHISNFNDRLEVMNESEAVSYIEGSLDLHEDILELIKKSNRKGSETMLDFIEQESPMSGFYSNGKRNTFMIDAAINEQRVKGYYLSEEKLGNGYSKLSDHFTITSNRELFDVSDKSLFDLHANQSKKNRLENVAKLLDRLIPKGPGLFILLEADKQLKKTLSTEYPLIAEAVRLIGLDGLAKTNYVESKIKKSINEAQKVAERKRIAKDVYKAITESSSIQEDKLLEKLTKIGADNVFKYKVTASLIRYFFESRRSTINKENVWIIGSKLIDA